MSRSMATLPPVDTYLKWAGAVNKLPFLALCYRPFITAVIGVSRPCLPYQGEEVGHVRPLS